MIGFYPEIRSVHIAAGLVSGSLFLLRGLAMWAGLTLGKTAPVRYLSYGIDTVLLTAALMLATMLHRVPFVDPWLTTKLTLVVAYIGLGSYALTRGTSFAWRRRLFLVAVATFAMIYTVARSRGSSIWA